MDEAEFDKFADEYATLHKAGIAVSGEGPEYFAEYKIIDILHEYMQHSERSKIAVKILDFGAGIGGSVPFIRKYFPSAQLTCLDVSLRSLKFAEKRFPEQAQYIHFGGAQIPFPQDNFDIAFAMCVFHHIDHAEHVSLLQELRRVLRPGGSLFIFEHNPFNPLTVRVVNNCPFDKNAQLIRAASMKEKFLAAGFKWAKIRYRIFFPNFLRALRPVEAAMTWLPLGGQYYILSQK